MNEHNEIVNRECEMYHFHQQELEAQAQVSKQISINQKTEEEKV